MNTLLDSTREKLRKLSGQEYLFPDSKTRKILGFEIAASEDITLLTNKGNVIKHVSEMPLFIDTLKMADTNLPALPIVDALVEAQQKVDLMVPLGEVASMLMANMKKLQTDPEYVNQAREINAAATTIVNIAKVRIDALRTVQAFQKNNK